MAWKFFLVCPECGKDSETISDGPARPVVNCGDCLMERLTIVEFDVVRSYEEVDADGHRTRA